MFRRPDKQRMRRTLEERALRNFLHRSMVIRCLIVVLSLAGLITLALSGGRLDPLDLTVGQISPRTMIARVNFSYRDERATNLEVDRRVSMTPNLYRLSLEAFERDFGRCEHLMERVAVLRQSGRVTEKKLQQIAEIWNEGAKFPLSAGEVQTLLFLQDKKGFIDTLRRLSGTVAQAGIAGDDMFSNPDMTISYARRPEDFTQLKEARAGTFLTASQARLRVMEQVAVAMSLTPAVTKTVERLVTELVSPNLQLDFALSSKFQAQQRKRIDPVYRTVTKGNPLIERGERLTDEKLILLKAHEAEAEREFANQSRWRQRAGTAALVAVIIGAAILILAFEPGTGPNTSNREYALLATVVLLHFVLCRATLYAGDVSQLSPSLLWALIPCSFGPMLAAILLARRHALLSAFVCSTLLTVITHFNFAVLLSSLISSVVAIYTLSPLRRRSRIYEAGLLAGVVAATINFIVNFSWDVSWSVMGSQAGISVAAAIVASLLVSAFLPLLEAFFKVTTDLRWLELADLNHPLLRRMVMEAPGTYHHSLVVANLSERACEAIGAHALQARVCSYFHDIGKLNKPEYFCENQAETENPHDDIAPNMSALIIIAHVKDGVDLALQYRLTRPIIDAIQQHHGTSQVSYFYRRAKQNEEDAKLGSKIMRLNVSDVERVEEGTYRYPGPKAQTKEIAILSLADSVEGASRAMLKPTPQKIETMISEIIDDRYRDGQLEETPLSFKELKLVADSFAKTLLSMMHTRVSYPKDEPNVDQPASLPSAAAQ